MRCAQVLVDLNKQMLQQLFSPLGVVEPKSVRRRKTFVQLIERLCAKGYRVSHSAGTSVTYAGVKLEVA